MHSIKKNYIYNLIYQILLVVAPLVVTPYVSRVLQPAGIGLQSYSGSIVSYFALVAALGTATFGPKVIGTLQGDAEGRSRKFWEIFVLRLAMTLMAFAAYLAYALFSEEGDGRTIALIFGLQLFGMIFDVTWFFQGMEEFGKISLSSVAFRIANIACIFIFVHETTDLALYVLFSVLFPVAANVSLWLYLPKFLVRVKGIHPFADLKTVLQLFVPAVAIQVYTILDKSMIGWFTDGTAQNGYYEQAEKVVKMSIAVVGSLGTVMVPRLSQKFSEGDEAGFQFYLYKLYRCVMLAAIPMMLGLIVISDVFVPTFFGAGYEECVLLLCIFSLLALFIGLNSVTNAQFLVPTNRQNVFTVIVVLGAVVNCAFNLLLIPRYQAVGACIASVIGEFVVLVAGLIYVAKKKLFRVLPIFATSVRYWIGGAVMFVCLYFLKGVAVASVWWLIALIAIGIAVYALSLFLMRDALFLELCQKLFGKLIRRKAPAAAAGEDGGSSAPAAAADDMAEPSVPAAAEEEKKDAEGGEETK